MYARYSSHGQTVNLNLGNNSEDTVTQDGDFFPSGNESEPNLYSDDRSATYDFGHHRHDWQMIILVFVQHLRLLLWKNLWLQCFKHHYVVTAIQISLPLLFPLIFALTNRNFELKGAEQANITVFEPMDEKELMSLFYQHTERPNSFIAYAPKSGYVDDVIIKLKNLYDELIPETKHSTLVWQAFDSELNIEAGWQTHIQQGNLSLKAAIVFHGGFNISSNREISDNHTFSYTIRIPEFSNEIDLILGQYRAPQQNASDPYPKVASALQIMIDKVLTDEFTAEGFPPEKIMLQAFPRLRTPLTNSETIGKYFNTIFPMLVSLGFLIIIPSTVGAVVREKESGMRELMRANGLSPGVNCVGWILTWFILEIVTITFVCILLFTPFNLDVGGIVKNGDSILLWITLLLLFGACASSWCILFSSFFDRASVAVAAGTCLWMISYAFWASTLMYQTDEIWKYVLSLFPNLALTFGAEILLKLDEAHAGSVDSLVVENLKASFNILAVQMFFIACLYPIIPYVHSIFTTWAGAGNPWKCFDCSKDETCESCEPRGRMGDMSSVDPYNIREARTCKLTKKFGESTIDCGCVCFKGGTTTLLLGPNGAGKSTLLSMLAGLQTPSTGTSYICGRSITTRRTTDNRCVGYCPQIDTFWNDLTVLEHLQFFQLLKYLRVNRGELNGMLEWLNLVSEQNTLPVTLSRGQRRKLNLGMAELGDPHVLLLDEPISRVDAATLVGIHELVWYRQMRKRPTVMTSHHLGECKRLGSNPLRLMVFAEQQLRVIEEDGLQSNKNLLERKTEVTKDEDNKDSVPSEEAPLLEMHPPHPEFPPAGTCFLALLWKRSVQARRNWRLQILQFVLPLAITIFAFVGAEKARNCYSSTPDSIRMDLEAYEDSVTLYSTNYSVNLPTISKPDENLFKLLVGPGAEKVDSIIESLVQIADNDSKRYRNHYIVSAELDSSGVKAMFSSTRPEAASIALNLAANYILSAKIGSCRRFLEVHSNPLTNKVPSALDAASPMPTFVVKEALVVVATLPIGLAILAAGFVVVPVTEKASKVKHLQLMTGLNGLVYWGSSFAWDLLLMSIVTIPFVCSMMFIGPYDTFFNQHVAGVLTLILLVYGFASISFSYLIGSISQRLSSGSLAFIFVMTLHLFTGTICTVTVYSLEMLASTEVANRLSFFLSAFPSFAMSWSIMRFTEIATLNSRCKAVNITLLGYLCDRNSEFDLGYRSCCRNCTKYFSEAPCFEEQPYLQWFSTRIMGEISAEGIGIGQEIVIMVAMGCIFLFALAAIECRFSKYYTGARTIGKVTDDTGSPSPSELVARSVSKSYDSKRAVSEVNLNVKPGDLFFLIGRNGAGKSTLIRILTGDDTSSEGFVGIGDVSVRKHRMGMSFLSKTYLSKIGYCPQQGGLIENLSGKEILELFLRLRGFVRHKDRENIVDHLLKKFGLRDVQHILCGKYSEGLKRRLSVAVALIGNPPVVILDEPMAGVDTEGRELLWNIIKSLKNLGRSVIISTHDVEEYGKLCSSFGIMLDGKMKESGNVVDIRPKYADIMVGTTYGINLWYLMTLKAIAAKYRYFVDKFGYNTDSKFILGDPALCWFSLRSIGNRETQDKFKQKIANEVLLRPSLRGTGNLIGFRSMEVVENFLPTALQHLTSRSEGGFNGDYETFPDIEYQIERNQLHPKEISTVTAMKYTVAQQRVRFKSQFENEIKSDALHGKSPIAEGSLSPIQPLDPAIPVDEMFTIKLSNHLDFYLQTDVKEITACGDYIIQGPEFVHSRTRETFIVNPKERCTTQLRWVALSFKDYEYRIYVTIGCVPLGDGRFILTGGLRTRDETSNCLLETLLDLPTSPDSWRTLITAPVSQPFVSFVKFGKYLVKVEVPEGPRLEIKAKILEIRKISVENEINEEAKRSSILDRVFWDYNIEFQAFYIQRLLSRLYRCWETGFCAALIDIENFLNVSLKNETENYAPIDKNSSAGYTSPRTGGAQGEGTSRQSMSDSQPDRPSPVRYSSQTLNPPAEILPSTREIFYDCGCVPIQKMFSYEIESTDLSFIVGLKVQEKDSSFAIAFVQSSTVTDESFENLMDSSQLNNFPNRRFGYAKDGEQAVQIGNVIALVNMTEPKCRDTRSFWQHNNSQLSIKIFTI